MDRAFPRTEDKSRAHGGSEPDIQQIRVIADWMDKRYVDPILGLVFPGAGDTLGALMGLYAIFVAAKLRVHPVIIARMLVNLGADALLGAIPVLGWIADFFFRAHQRNLRLLEERGRRGEPTASDWAWVMAAVAFFLIALATPLILLVLAGALLLSWL